jgi:hypothetical protein
MREEEKREELKCEDKIRLRLVKLVFVQLVGGCPFLQRLGTKQHAIAERVGAVQW